MRAIIIVLGILALTAAAQAAPGAPDDQQTDDAFIKDCKPLVDRQWQYHGFHNQYSGTHIVYAQTSPDFMSTWADGSTSKKDYQVPVVFLRKDGTYDLAVLLCHIDHNGKDSIDGNTPQPITMGVINEIEDAAVMQLPNRKLHSWVDASRAEETVWPTPRQCAEVKSDALTFCSRLSRDVYAYCLNQEITARGCQP